MIISILNEKGGTGKTTLAIHISRALTKKGKKTLLIDSDVQGSALEWAKKWTEDLLDLVCVNTPTLHTEIKKYLPLYEYIIIDGTCGITDMTANSIRVSDLVLIPLQPSDMDLKASKQIVRLVKERQEITDGKLKVALIINRDDNVNTILSRKIKVDVQDFSLPVFQSLTKNRIAYRDSYRDGLTVLDGIYKNTEASREIEQIVKELEEFENAHIS